ncbi:hypothetical protein FHT44_005126 [Mycolicibacterium sp. BK634]|uniref:hypothetical protein n=1 Tax=Mycolicibacterium sp. BK634 TaxID=2587099 RepID=UPI00160A4CBC|nr:hypothetical protein [Mycolicibacterium sp. BK634]MBB3752614.1 hypothetical protein [Mycolicibacterium sp. BK634]
MYDEAPEDVEEVLVVWLGQIHRAAVTRRNKDPLPFILVRHIDGKEDTITGTADFLVSVRVLSDKNLGEDAAAEAAKDVHRQMLELAQYLPDVPLSSGRNASLDYVTVTQSPRWVPYDNDQVLCKQAQYQIGLSYAPA